MTVAQVTASSGNEEVTELCKLCFTGQQYQTFNLKDKDKEQDHVTISGISEFIGRTFLRHWLEERILKSHSEMFTNQHVQKRFNATSRFRCKVMRDEFEKKR